MVIYHFKVLILGRDLDIIHFYTSRAFGEPGEDRETFFEYYKEIKVFEDVSELEINCITNVSADLDEKIPEADGIIYFLNPLYEEEFEYFKMILPVIFEVKRDIPTIIVFYDQNGILPIDVNELLTTVWVNYPSLEAFVNLYPNEFHQVLQSLCLAMINADTPLNIENAWMRFPIFIQMANVYFNNKNYYYAAQAVRKAALIADIYNKQEYYIISEQAAFLYSKVNLFLEASKILENIDKRKSVNFKKLYAREMIRDANLYFNKEDYEVAAKKYERAGQWASIELLDKEMIQDAFRLAITSWISACRVENAFRILDSLPHGELQTILKEVTEKIGAVAEYLIETDRFEAARQQLYLAINKYQREALTEELKYLTEKSTYVLIHILKHQVKSKEVHAAKYTYDEIENMWDSYNVERTDLDGILRMLINAFIEIDNFSMATTLINKLDSLTLKQELTKISAEAEDKYNASKKKEKQEIIQKGVDILTVFVKAELDLLIEMNKKAIEEAKDIAKQGNYLKAAKHLYIQANYLKKIGKEEVRDQILTKSLDFLIQGALFEEFIITFNSLSIAVKKKYLIRVYNLYLDKLKGIEELEDFPTIVKIMEHSIRIYRDHSWYDESKEISLLFIEFIKNEAIKILDNEKNLSGIRTADALLKKANGISSAYLEKETKDKIKFDKIYSKIAEIYISLDDLHSAYSYNEKIEDKAYKKEIHKKIDKLEAVKIAERSQRAREAREEEKLEEDLSILENIAREYNRLERDKDLRERNVRKKRYFNKALNHIAEQDFEKAIELYKESIANLTGIKRYNLASVSLAVLCLLLLKEDKSKDANQLSDETKGKLMGFSETFPVKLVEYILRSKKYDEFKFNQGLSFLKYMPLFDEELNFINEVFGEDLKLKREPSESDEKIIEDVTSTEKLSKVQIIEIDQKYEKIQKKMGEIRREKVDMQDKRKAIKRIFYRDVFLLLGKEDYKELALKYYELANSMSRRKDFTTSSLLILLHGLSLLKAKEPMDVIEKSINDFLKNLGMNRNWVEDTYYILLLQFIIDTKIYNLHNYLPKIQVMLEVLPLFEEEMQLLTIEV
ncbi:MAG: hypothetical protein ACFFEN_06770 [Candidatus Thorarchaeota archaeon]